MECGKTRNHFSSQQQKIEIEVKERLYWKIQQRIGIEIQSQYWDGNRQLSTEGIDVYYFTKKVDPWSNNNNLIRLMYKWRQRTRCMWFKCLHGSFIQKQIELGILVSGMSNVWEDTDGFGDQYICAMDIYLFIVLSSLCGIIMDFVINVLGHGRNVFDGIKDNDKRYLK